MITDLAPFVAILGRGPILSRGLTAHEAEAAFEIILTGDPAPQAVGALLMLLRMKGETAEEIAGFVRAARRVAPLTVQPALDWPSYAAGRTRGLPWFLLSAKLVAQAGYPVVLHGWNSHQTTAASVRAALPLIGIPVVDSTFAVGAVIANDGIAYLPLEVLSPRLFDLLRLRDVLGLRSCINTVLRVLNPGCAQASVQGVFHPPYRDLQRDAGLILGQRALTVLKGGGGEFERSPAKDVALFGLREGTAWDATGAALAAGHIRLADGSEARAPEALAALWSGDLQDDFALSVVLGTADLALDTLGSNIRAQDLWAARPQLDLVG